MRSIAATICFVSILTNNAIAKNLHETYSDGEKGYKVGCSVASSLNIPSCGELPSGQKFLKKENQPTEKKKQGSGVTGAN